MRRAKIEARARRDGRIDSEEGKRGKGKGRWWVEVQKRGRARR